MSALILASLLLAGGPVLGARAGQPGGGGLPGIGSRDRRLEPRGAAIRPIQAVRHIQNESHSSSLPPAAILSAADRADAVTAPGFGVGRRAIAAAVSDRVAGIVGAAAGRSVPAVRRGDTVPRSKNATSSASDLAWPASACVD
ncbi:MAG: hypothetical protein IT481_02885, partial [Gammaproteobacteria bacterium]|nr:hypothetical protein [Gammaproteobacteria bacterium]